MKRILSLFLSVLMICTVLAGCKPSVTPSSSGPDSSTASSSDGTSEKSDTLNMLFASVNTTQSGWLYGQGFADDAMIWDQLYRMDAKTNEIKYLLATNMVVSEDGMTITFTIRDDAKWHDGEPFTVDDVLYTWNSYVAGKFDYYSSFSSFVGYDEVVAGTAKTMRGLTAPDKKTIVVKLKKPDYTLLSNSSSNIFAAGIVTIIPYHIFKDIPATEIRTTTSYWEAPIGTGPYKISESSYPNYVKLVRNADYYGAAPGIENIVLHIYTDAEAMNAALLAGDMDIAEISSVETAENIVAQNTAMKSSIYNAGYTRMFYFNLTGTTKNDKGNTNFQNAKVRQGLNLLLDKQAIVDYCGINTAVATTWNNDNEYNADIPTFKRDVAAGKALLEEAGFDFNTTFRMVAYYTDQATVDIMELIVQNFAEGGVKATYVIDPSLVDMYAPNWYDAMYCGGGAGSRYYSFLGTNGSNEYCFNGFDSTRREIYKTLGDKYAGTPDAAKKKQYAAELQIEFMKDMYIIPIYFRNSLWVYNAEKLKGYSGISTDFRCQGYYDFENWSILK